MVWLFMVTLNEAGLCFGEFNSIKLVLLQLRDSLLDLSQWSKACWLLASGQACWLLASGQTSLLYIAVV